MRRSSSAVRRRGAIGAAVSLGLHAALALVWVLQRPEPPLPEPPAITVVLVRPQLFERERRRAPLVTEAKLTIPAQTRAVLPASETAARPTATADAGASTLAPDVPAVPAPPSPQPSLGALGRALAARAGCSEPERLTEDERERCTALVMAAPEHRIRETNPHVRVAEHVAVMARVRRAENTAYRMSCEGYRNLDPTCPNLLPDNKPEDFEPPKD